MQFSALREKVRHEMEGVRLSFPGSAIAKGLVLFVAAACMTLAADLGSKYSAEKYLKPKSGRLVVRYDRSLAEKHAGDEGCWREVKLPLLKEIVRGRFGNVAVRLTCSRHIVAEQLGPAVRGDLLEVFLFGVVMIGYLAGVVSLQTYFLWKNGRNYSIPLMSLRWVWLLVTLFAGGLYGGLLGNALQHSWLGYVTDWLEYGVKGGKVSVVTNLSDLAMVLSYAALAVSFFAGICPMLIKSAFSRSGRTANKPPVFTPVAG